MGFLAFFYFWSIYSLKSLSTVLGNGRGNLPSDQRGLKELILQKMSNSLLPRILYWEQEVRLLIFPLQESGKPEVLSVISSWNYTKDVIEFDQ